jgi:HEAT repeat protein
MRLVCVAILCALTSVAQDVRPKDVREIGKAGQAALPRLQELLKNPSVDVRVEAVKQITSIGGLKSLDALVQACHDNDAEVQIHATDGLVNFYLPGYVQSGFGASVKRVGTSIKGHFTDTNDQMIDPYLHARPDVVQAIGELVRGGNGMEVRANAARAAGILRGREAVPDLIAALRTKDSAVMYESLIALQKIRDESAGPQMSFLLRDLDSRVQLAAIETTGLLKNHEAVPDLIGVLNRSKDAKVRRAVLGSLAMMPDEKSRPLFAQYLKDKDDRMRAAAAEGFARMHQSADLATVDQAWKDETKGQARVSLAFAMVSLGHTEAGEFTPLQYLINNLNSSAYKGEAQPFLTELARDASVRTSLHGALERGTKDEKIGLARVLSASGDKESVRYLEKLSRDPDPEVAKEGLLAMRTLQGRL